MLSIANSRYSFDFKTKTPCSETRLKQGVKMRLFARLGGVILLAKR